MTAKPNESSTDPLPAPSMKEEEEQQQQQQQDWTKTCPICLTENELLVRPGRCGHEFCMECLEQFFRLPSTTAQQESAAASVDHSTSTINRTVPAGSTLNVQELQNYSIEGIDTLGRCPLCRLPVSLLDIDMQQTNKNSKLSAWASGRQTNLKKSPLAGKVYATRRGIGYNSFHFPPFGNENDNKDETSKTGLPYLLWQDDDAFYTGDSSTDTSPNNANKPIKYFFEPGCFYFSPKRSFHGTVLLPDSYGNLQSHNVLLSFASNHKWITGGFMLHHFAASFPSNQEDDNKNAEAKLERYFPLDGRWKVTWYKEQLPPDASLDDDTHNHLITESAHVNVIGSVVQDESPLSYMLRYQNPEHVYFYWPGMNVKQTLEAACDFRSTSVPAVGDRLKWTTTDPRQPYIVWQRETIQPPLTDLTSISYFGRSGGDSFGASPFFDRLRNDQCWYREWNAAQAADQPNEGLQYHANELWGNTFVQSLRVGLASYHFGRHTNSNDVSGEGEPFAYISYEHPACLQWPLLDDGSPIPPRVFFRDISVERVEETRPNSAATENGSNNNNTPALMSTSHLVFRGNIDWLLDYGTTWQNNERWEYEMHFDSQLTCIVSGTVHCVVSGSTSREEMSRFGDELIYVNAGICSVFEEWISSEELAAGSANESTSSQALVSYRDRATSFRRRLHAEGATVRTVALVGRIMTGVLTSTYQPSDRSNIDYNL